MANTSMLQVRTDASDREKAAAILDSLGTNLSAVVNMLLKQIILTRGIPF
jgi:addiction module RelB/DinJ family antitoxin